ncbi:MAG: type VI secretion system contractile sheath large subunit [Desulfobulbus sp.]
MQIPEKPFFIVAFGPFLPAEKAEQSGAVQPLPIQSVDHGLALFRPSLYVPLPKSLSPEAGIVLEFTSLADFSPSAIVARTPWLKALQNASRAGSSQRQSTAGATTLDSILDMVELPGEQAESASRRNDEGLEAEALVSGVLTRIFSDEDFRRMEAAWQGVALLFEAAGEEELRLALVPVTRESAAEVLAGSADLLDDEPPDLLLVDAPFDATPVGMQLLEAAANLGERQMAPAVCWFGPDFLHLDTWADLDHLPYLPNHLETFAYARWKALRAQSSALWTVAACNRFSLQPSSPGSPATGLSRQRKPNYLAPVWGVAALLLQAKARTGSPLGLSSQLLRIQNAMGEDCMPLECSITDDRGQQMVDSGLLPLVQSSNKGLHLVEARTINGASILLPLILSTVIHTLIGLREDFGPSSDPDLLAATLEKGFCQHPCFKGALPAGTVTFEAVGNDTQGHVILAIKLKHRAFGATNIECTFNW